MVGDYVPTASSSSRAVRSLSAPAPLRRGRRRRRRRRPVLRGARAGQRGLRVLLSTTPRSSPRRSASPAAAAATSPTSTPARRTSCRPNPDFCRSALARYTPRDFIALVERHGIAWHEKHKGQLFCDGSSAQIIDMLLAECARRRRASAGSRAAVARGERTATAGFGLETVARPGRRRRAGRRHRRPVDPEDRRQRLRLPVARQFGLARRRAAPGAGAADLRRRRLGSRSRRWPGVALPVRIERRRARSRRRLRRRPAVHAPRPERPGGAADLDLLAAGRARCAIDLAPGRRPGGAAARRPRPVAATRSATCWPSVLPRRLADAWLQRDARAGRAAARRAARPRPGRSWPSACSAGARARAAPRATARPRSPPAASTPAS